MIKKLSLAALSGVLYFVGFVGFDVWPLIFVFIVPLLIALEGVRLRTAFLLGAVSGMVAMMGGYYWVVHLLRAFAGLNLPLAILGYVLLCIYQGLYVGFIAVLVRFFDERLSVPAIYALPIAWCAVELAFPFIFPSFVGNALYEVSILTQIVDLFGMYGLSALICLVNAGLYLLWVARRDRKKANRLHVSLAGAALLLAIIYGAVRIPAVEEQIASAPKLEVAMIQTNLGARDKAEKRAEFIRRHQAMSREVLEAHPDLDLIVWPESAYNRWIRKDTIDLSKTVMDRIPAPAIFGALTWDKGVPGEGRRRIYNTAVATSSTGHIVEQFDKVELLVFGETIPLIDTFPQIRSWFPRTSTFTRGTNFVNFEVAGTALMPMICYEDIIPSFVRKMWRKAGPAEVLVNVTNDSWYGDTHEPLIHLALATFRSIETRRALIRSTNTGISAFVDPVGRIVARTGQWTRETLVGEVPMNKSRESTVYMVVGDILGWLSLLAVAAGLVMGIRKKRPDR